MIEYKELTADLLAAASRNSNSLNTRDTCRKAADAIEQLMTDIDAVRKERDAAVKDLQEWCDELCYCEVCKHNGKCSKEFCKFANNWEWRGVQE